MNDVIVKSTITEINTIFHIADVHVRNLKRHKEYKHVFRKLYSYIRKNKNANSIIYLAGDIVHSKTDISPELVSVVGEFLNELANICPLVIIPGNHDCNLNNTNRMDALSPIISALNNDNIFYWKDTGIYRLGNVAFNVMSVFDSPKKYISGDSFDADYKIALHHGAVNKAQTDLGFEINNQNVQVDIFDGHDLVLLGDIHKRQFLQVYNENKRKPAILYPGSLIQQNHAETLDKHGLAVWDLPSRTCKFVDVDNNYGYYTIEVENGKILNWTDSIPKYPRLRIRSVNTDPADLARCISDIKNRRKVQELTIQRVRDFTGSPTNSSSVSVNVRDVEVQNKLITEYLESKYMLDSETLDSIRHVNRITNSKLSDLQRSRSILWVPKRFEFDNMFSYGPNNVIDFTNMDGIYGLFAANATGKSSLLDALSFCCYDKCSRTSKAVHVLNTKKEEFRCKLEFEIDEQLYVIERSGKKNKQGRVPVIVDFYRIDSEGNKESLNGGERDETNKIIRQYIGEYDDFIITAYSVQNNNSAFIDKSQRERKELLSSFLDIGIFENLYKVANDEIRETSTLLKQANLQNYAELITENKLEIDKLRKYEQYKLEEKREAEQEITDLDSLIDSTAASLKSITGNLESPDSIRDKIQVVEDKLVKLNIELLDNTSEKDKIDHIAIDIETKLSVADKDALDIELVEFENKSKEYSKLCSDITILRNTISHFESLDKSLSEHQYDPECEYCVRNEFVVSAQEARDKLPELTIQLVGLHVEIDNLKLYISKSNIKEKLQIYDRLYKQLLDLRAKLSNLNITIQKITHQISSLNRDLSILKNDLSASLENLDNIKKNEELNMQLAQLRSERDMLKENYNSINEYLTSIKVKIALKVKDKETSERGLDELKRLQRLYKNYEYYIECISRNGLPYKLIETMLPKLESEINNILAQVVDFNIVLHTDEKNINAYIVYDDNNIWPIELVSGMERFVASLAIRASLINISSLPRTNFLVIDEGLGNLDGNMLTSIGMMFDYLKTQFQFIIMISHIDSSKDIAEKHIELHKDNGYSKLNFES